MKILAFGASNSRNSINKQLASHAAHVFEEIYDIAPRHDGPIEINLIDLNDFEMPIYGVDLENEKGIPELAKQFYQKIGDADALIISYAEHNGHYTSAFKNIFDWTSRVDKKIFQNKPMVIMSASSGKSGGASVLEAAKKSAPFFGAVLVASLRVGSFYEVFDASTGRLIDKELEEKLYNAMVLLREI